MIHGYIVSSLLYFYVYAKLKEKINSSVDSKKTESQAPHSLSQTLVTSFVASAVSEVIALWLYYPYDLVKTRMQTSNEVYKYRNLFDAVLKIYSQSPTRAELKSSRYTFFTRMKRYYCGMGLYGVTYTSFIAIEFSLYESLL